MTADLSLRAVGARELMDDPHADLDMLTRTYERFALVNAIVSRWHSVYRRDIRPRAGGHALRILDIGAGGGDVSRAIASWARRDGLDIEVTALDIDDRAIDWARSYDTIGDVRYLCASSSTLAEAGEKFDVVLSNHLLHHLDAGELQNLLIDSARLVAADGVAVHRDIERSRLAYLAFAAGTWPFAANLLAGSFIRADGLTSIRRSYTRRELAAVAPPGWSVDRGFPARIALRWEAGHG